MNHTNQNLHIVNLKKTTIFSYWPIALIYLLSLGLATFTVKFSSNPDYMSHFMGFVLVLFGLIKLNDVKGFASGFANYDPIANRSPYYAEIYPFLEILLGVLFITQLFILPATLVTLVIYSASLCGALRSLFNKEELHCVCLGTYFKLPLSKVTIIESVVMILMCIWMLAMFSSMTGMS